MAGRDGEERGLRAYARSVETRFRRLGGSARLVSPREFALILDWYERRVPLHLVLGALEEAFAKEEGIGSLSYLRRPVDRLFRSYREARLGGSAEGGAAILTRGELLASLSEARGAILRAAVVAGPQGESLLGIAGALEEIETELSAGPREEGAPGLEAVEARLAELDTLLLDTARARLGAEECARLAREADERLEAHREAMSEEVFLRTRERHAQRLIRRALELPELSLFCL